MFKKRSSAAPILQKVSSLLKVPIMIISRRMRKPVIPRIISLKKSRKKMLFSSRRHHYNYGYQFSTSSSSPLIQYHCYRKPPKKKNGYGSDLYSIAFLGKCLGMMKEKTGRRSRRSSGFSSSCSSNSFMSYDPRPLMEVNDLPSADVQNTLVSSSSSSSDVFSGGQLDDSIDERAEKFIERFYEEMRLQRQESFLSF